MRDGACPYRLAHVAVNTSNALLTGEGLVAKQFWDRNFLDRFLMLALHAKEEILDLVLLSVGHMFLQTFGHIAEVPLWHRWVVERRLHTD